MGKDKKMSEEFKTIETQEQFDAAIKGRLEREKVKYEGQIEALNKKIEEQSGDFQKQISELTQALNTAKEEKATFDTTIAEKDAKLKEYELHSVKTQVAHELGLSYEAVNFLQGSDENEIRKSAEALKGLVKVTTTPLANPEPNIKDTEKATKDLALRQMSRNLMNE